MTTGPRSGTRRRSLQEDLLDDLRQGPARPAAAPVTALSLPPLREQAAPAASDLPSPALELRITPRSWASAGWTRRSGGDGLTISLGPLCLSIGRLPA
jgi:hypothetical protein